MPKTYMRKTGRLKLLANNNLGIVDRLADSSLKPIFRGDPGTRGGFDSLSTNGSKKCRTKKLETLDKYYKNKQYDHLMDWEEACANEDYVKVRERKPRIIFGFAKLLASRVAAKLVGNAMFPALSIENDPDDSEFVRTVVKAAKLRSRLIEPMRLMCGLGSVFVRFYIVGKAIKVEHFNTKYCYPVFDESGELVQIEIKYVFDDQEDRDSQGNPRQKWYRMVLSTMSDVIFDNPPYKDGVDPVFVVAEKVDHNMGFVQGEWFRTSEDKHSPDGYALSEDILDFIDELCYSLSQSSQSVGYNQEPQVVMNGMDEEDIEALVRSSQKAWNLGKEGKAQMLEGGMKGVEAATELRDKVRLGIQDLTRVILLDPEKIVGSASSGKAMEVLHGPLVELINELRPMVEGGIINLTTKIAVAILLIAQTDTAELPITMPPGFTPDSLDIIAAWPDIFPMTIEDLQKKVSVALSAKGGGMISPETALKYIAKDFGVEDIEAELKKIVDAQAAEAALNPFGGF
jgi:hypothetical protein